MTNEHRVTWWIKSAYENDELVVWIALKEPTPAIELREGLVEKLGIYGLLGGVRSYFRNDELILIRIQKQRLDSLYNVIDHRLERMVGLAIRQLFLIGESRDWRLFMPAHVPPTWTAKIGLLYDTTDVPVGDYL